MAGTEIKQFDYALQSNSRSGYEIRIHMAGTSVMFYADSVTGSRKFAFAVHKSTFDEFVTVMQYAQKLMNEGDI